jgi:hypothetical protein
MTINQSLEDYFYAGSVLNENNMNSYILFLPLFFKSHTYTHTHTHIHTRCARACARTLAHKRLKSTILRLTHITYQPSTVFSNSDFRIQTARLFVLQIILLLLLHIIRNTLEDIRFIVIIE